MVVNTDTIALGNQIVSDFNEKRKALGWNCGVTENVDLAELVELIESIVQKYLNK